MFGLGATELAIILAIVVVLFGARRLPEIGAGVGKAIKNFRAGMSGQDEIDVTPESKPNGSSSSEKPSGKLGETATGQHQGMAESSKTRS